MKNVLFPLSLIFFSAPSLGSCLKVIENKSYSLVVQSCFQVPKSESHLSFKQAIIHEKLIHEFGSFDQPSTELLSLKRLADEGDADAQYIYAVSIELAFALSKNLWFERVYGITERKKRTFEQEEQYALYYKQVTKLKDKYLLSSAEAGNREAMLLYVNKRLNPYTIAPEKEIEKALKFANKLNQLGEPNSEYVIEQLHSLLLSSY